MFILETDRLILRPWKSADREPFRTLAQDPLVMRYINNGVPLTDQEVDETLARQARTLAEHGVCMGAMVERASGEVVGVAGIQPLGTTGDMEIGWWVAPRLWGRGYATEAGAAAMQYVLDVLGRNRVVAIIDPPNHASKAVAAKLGMKLERECVTGAELGHRRPSIVVDLFSCEKGARSRSRNTHASNMRPGE